MKENDDLSLSIEDAATDNCNPRFQIKAFHISVSNPASAPAITAPIVQIDAGPKSSEIDEFVSSNNSDNNNNLFKKTQTKMK